MNTNNNIILSILIPTRNRQEYTLNVIKHILGINDNRFQLIVQDNSETDSLKALLNNYLSDNRIKYYYTQDVLSFVDNFSIGISNCMGEYVTVIGDDDTINPAIIDIAEIAYNKGIKAITPTLPLIYFWPQSGVYSDKDQGRLAIASFSCSAKYYNTKKEVKKLLKNGCQNYLSFNLAKAYHGLIKKSVLDELKDKTGNYIGGLSPDIYLSIGISLLIDEVLTIDYPLTISGICNKSGSADSATGKHTGALEQAPHFKGHINYKWSSIVPKFYSVETIWGDSALAAIMDLKCELIDEFEIDVISAYCLKSNPEYKKIILGNLAKYYNISENSYLIKFHLLNGYLRGPLSNLIKRMYNKVFDNKSVNIFNEISDIQEASNIVQKDIIQKNTNIINNITN